jgi:hypothetical protein
LRHRTDQRISGTIVDVLGRAEYPGSIEVAGGFIRRIIRDARVKRRRLLIPGFLDATVVIAMLTVFGLSHPPITAADVLTVTDCGDTTPGGAPGQLRRLISEAATGDTIMVPACTIVLTGTSGEDANAGGDLDVAQTLIIQGAGRTATIIDGAHRDRVFDIGPATVTLRDMTIQHGGFDFNQGVINAGGAILNVGTLSVIGLVVANSRGGSDGGGIYNVGVLTVIDSTISGNGAGGPAFAAGGGGLANVGGVATISRSTISGNTASGIFSGFGGGLLNNGGVLHLTNATMSGNGAGGTRGGTGGGIYSFDGVLTLVSSTVTANKTGGLGANSAGVSATGQPSAAQSIIAGNIVENDPAFPFPPVGMDCGGGSPILSQGSNLSGDASCGFNAPSDLINTDPLLGPLADNGGPTLTHTLLSGSPAIDRADCVFGATDQRGVARPQPTLGGRCDMGAVEVVQFYAGGVFVAVAPLDGSGGAEIVTGSGQGGPPRVRTFNAAGALGLTLSPYNESITTGVRVAACDFNADNRAEIVTGPGPGGGPHVLVYDVSTGASPTLLASFFAYHPAFAGGIFVACGDVDGDGMPDLITGADAGGGPHVRAFKIQAGVPGGVVPLVEFFAFPPGFAGGVRVAAGNVDGSDRASIIVGAGPGGGPHVRVLKFVGGASPLQELASFCAYAPGFAGGVFVGAGHVLGDGRADVITGAGAGGGPHVRVFTGAGGDTGVSFFAYSAAFAGGVRVAGGDLDGSGASEIVTAAGPGGGPHVAGFTGGGGGTATSFYAY